MNAMARAITTYRRPTSPSPKIGSKVSPI